MLTLYEHPLSPYAQKCKIALYEKGIEFDTVVPDLIGTGANMGDFLAANPRAEVPALLDDEVRIFDSTIILEYIEEKWPAPALMPRDPAERARQRMIEEVMDSLYEPINWGCMEVAIFKRVTGDLANHILGHAANEARQLQDWLERQLGGHEWFAGEQFGWADLSVFPYLAGSGMFGLSPRDESPLTAWFARASHRDSVARTAEAANAFANDMPDFEALMKSGQFKREYRDSRLEWMIRAGGIDVVRDGLRNNTIRFSYLPS